ncbi:MAG: NAD(P)H-binding protein [Anaerolineales bacterium]|nr:NAD(P)H-binding protein [Anaerolineales bacterium]
MILVTGATGFIGQALIRQLLADGQPVRALIRPSEDSPGLPKGLAVEAALSTIEDFPSLRTAMVDIDTIYHLVGLEWQGVSADLGVEIEGIQSVIQAATEAGVSRIIYLSHIGADRASAYTVMKVKGIVEEYIRKSGLAYTIIRTGLVYGENDHFTTALAKLIAVYPFLFFLPAPGNAMLQPVWVEDLVTALTWLLDNDELNSQTIEVGGPEFLSIREVVEAVMQTTGMNRTLVNLRPSTLRMVAVILEYLYPNFPHSVYWLDYLANDRTCEIDSVSRHFGLLPVRFNNTLDYLKGQRWGKLARESLRRR